METYVAKAIVREEPAKIQSQRGTEGKFEKSGGRGWKFRFGVGVLEWASLIKDLGVKIKLSLPAGKFPK